MKTNVLLWRGWIFKGKLGNSAHFFGQKGGILTGERRNRVGLD